MKALKTPCNDCPFRKDSAPGWLGPYSGPLALHQFIMSETPFPCHLTHEEKDLAPGVAGSEKHPLCSGAIAYMKKNGKRPRNPALAGLVSACNDTEGILALPEFFQHHKSKKK